MTAAHERTAAIREAMGTAQTTELLATAAKRSDRHKRQLFIDPRTEAVSLLPAHYRKLKEWQLLTDAPNLTNDHFVVVTGLAAG